MTTSGIYSSVFPAKLVLVDLRVGRFCGVHVGSWKESAFCAASTPAE